MSKKSKQSPLGLPRAPSEALSLSKDEVEASRGPIPEDWDSISPKETDYCKGLLENNDYSRIKGFESLKNKVNAKLAEQNEENEVLFELRLADMFKEAVKNIKHERKTIDNTSVDFYCEFDNLKWFIECVSIRTSDAVKKATQSSYLGENKKVLTWEISLSSYNQDQRQTTGGEIIKAQEKIGEKVFNDGKNIKFKIPQKDEVNIIIVDMRGFNIGMMDHVDVNQICFGRTKQSPAEKFNGNPIIGLFDCKNKSKYAVIIRERIHFIIFVSEDFSASYDIESGRRLKPRIGFDKHYIAKNENLIGDKKVIFPFEGVPRE